MIIFMIESKNIDFSCFICHNSFYNMNAYTLHKSNSKRSLICKKCLSVKKLVC